MKILFDSSINEVKLTLEKEKTSLREAFQYVLHESSVKCEKNDLKVIKEKVEIINIALKSLTLENSNLKDKIA